MQKSQNKTDQTGTKIKTPFIAPKNNLKSEEFGLNKYLQSISKPKKNEVHLLNYYFNDKPVSYQINANTTTKLKKSEYDEKVKTKEVKGLVIRKANIGISESNALYICLGEKEELEEEKLLDDNGS